MRTLLSPPGCPSAEQGWFCCAWLWCIAPVVWAWRCECVTALPAGLFITCEYCHHLTKAIWNKCLCGTSFITQLGDTKSLDLFSSLWRQSQEMCFTWRGGSFPAAGGEMLLSAELLAVTEGLPLLSFISEPWLLAMQLHSLGLLWLLLSSLDCQKLSQSHFSVPCAAVDVVKWLKSFCRAILSQGLFVSIHGHSAECSPTSPHLGTAWSVPSLPADPAPALHREAEAVENLTAVGYSHGYFLY